MKRKGIIKITNQLYRDSWEEISTIFSKFKPAHIEFRHWENDMWYFYGTCDQFDELIEAQVVPVYNVIFTRSDDGVFSFKFQKA